MRLTTEFTNENMKNHSIQFCCWNRLFNFFSARQRKSYDKQMKNCMLFSFLCISQFLKSCAQASSTDLYFKLYRLLIHIHYYFYYCGTTHAIITIHFHNLCLCVCVCFFVSVFSFCVLFSGCSQKMSELCHLVSKYLSAAKKLCTSLHSIIRFHSLFSAYPSQKAFVQFEWIKYMHIAHTF